MDIDSASDNDTESVGAKENVLTTPSKAIAQPQTSETSTTPNNAPGTTSTAAVTTSAPTKASAIPTAYRPGRLSQIEILERVFPYQKRNVLELVLQGCNGDLVKAIEHFLSAQDTIMAQQQTSNGPVTSAHQSPNRSPPVGSKPTTHNGFHPYMTAFHHFRPPPTGGASKLPLNIPTATNLKSAFTPLSPVAGSYPALHSAFTPRAAAFNAEALLSRAPPGLLPPRDDALAPPPFHYPTLNQPLPFASPLFMNHYRPYSLTTSPNERTADCAPDRSPPQDGDCGDDDVSPHKDKD